MKIVDIGPEAFTTEEQEVISYRGQNFYRACDYLVTGVPEGPSTHCVKRINHPGKIHEDYDGHTIFESDMLVIVISCKDTPNRTQTIEAIQRQLTPIFDDLEKARLWIGIRDSAAEVLNVIHGDVDA